MVWVAGDARAKVREARMLLIFNFSIALSLVVTRFIEALRAMLPWSASYSLPPEAIRTEWQPVTTTTTNS